MSDNYNGWKKLDKIVIVYSVDRTVKVDDKEYPLAYIVEDGNKKQFESALWWGECRKYNRETGKTEKFSPKFITDNNSGFSLRILSAADDSSRGGKLSFWNCLMEKDGIESFVVGINADLLCDMVTETTLINGKTDRKVFFARKRGQLGILHSDMSTYKEMIADDERKKSINKKKTTKWRIGYEYDTLTCSDLFLGWFNDPLSIEFDDWYYAKQNTMYTIISFSDKSYPVYDTYSGVLKFDNMVVSKLSYMPYSNTCKCPSRQEGQKIFNIDSEESYYNMVADILIEDSAKNDSVGEYDKYNRFFRILRYAFRIFSHNHEATLKILNNLYDYYVNDCLAKHAEVNSFYRIGTFNIEYLQGPEMVQKYVVHSWGEYVKTLIEVVEMEIKNNG